MKINKTGTFGIDISKWQGNIDIKATGANFVIIKAGGSDDGLYMDSKFRRNYSECKKLNIPCGLYWYTKAGSVADLEQEIKFLLANIDGMKFELPIYLDIEEESIYDVSNDLAVYWLTALYEKKYYPGIYCGYYWTTDKLTDPIIGTFPFWLAYWDDDRPDLKWNYGLWQQGSKKMVGGLEVDIDWLFYDYESVIKENGLNGYTKEPFTDVNKETDHYKDIIWAADLGLVKGFNDGTFKPAEPLTRGQICTILHRLYNLLKG